jgi:hypothetical protein
MSRMLVSRQDIEDGNGRAGWRSVPRVTLASRCKATANPGRRIGRALSSSASSRASHQRRHLQHLTKPATSKVCRAKWITSWTCAAAPLTTIVTRARRQGAVRTAPMHSSTRGAPHACRYSVAAFTRAKPTLCGPSPTAAKRTIRAIDCDATVILAHERACFTSVVIMGLRKHIHPLIATDDASKEPPSRGHNTLHSVHSLPIRRPPP